MTLSVVVFIDAQNMYRGARQAFFDESSVHPLGWFYPQKLGQMILSNKPYGKESEDRYLKQVRIYTGMPSSTKDPRAYAARRRQVASWVNGGCEVRTRALRYPRNWPSALAEEKGIDVALAVDFVTMAVEGEYDIGVIASTDTDIRPAIEYVIGRPEVTAEVANWHSDNSRPSLSVAGRPWCHRLAKGHFDGVADYTDYNIAPGERR